LNAVTKNYLDKTTADLIHERMIAEAKRLLVYSSYTISEIAYQLNFNDNSYFNRFFKKAVSITPEQFRKRIISTVNS
jgi:AraC-like DNA-binding protein